MVSGKIHNGHGIKKLIRLICESGTIRKRTSVANLISVSAISKNRRDI